MFQWVIGVIQKIQHQYNSLVYRIATPTDTEGPTIVLSLLGR